MLLYVLKFKIEKYIKGEYFYFKKVKVKLCESRFFM